MMYYWLLVAALKGVKCNYWSLWAAELPTMNVNYKYKFYFPIWSPCGGWRECRRMYVLIVTPMGWPLFATTILTELPIRSCGDLTSVQSPKHSLCHNGINRPRAPGTCDLRWLKILCSIARHLRGCACLLGQSPTTSAIGFPYLNRVHILITYMHIFIS